MRDVGLNVVAFLVANVEVLRRDRPVLSALREDKESATLASRFRPDSGAKVSLVPEPPLPDPQGECADIQVRAFVLSDRHSAWCS